MTGADDRAGDEGWAIDELARRADLSVDTIRYYQREQLLHRPARRGRRTRYDRSHLDRLGQIRALQDKRFSLAAIKALLDADAPGVIEGLFIGDRDRYGDHRELAERAGIDIGLLEALADIGLLRPPAEMGREAYDGTDLTAVQVVRDLDELGLPREVLVELLTSYVEGVEDLQRRAFDALGTRLEGDDVDASLLETLTRSTGRLATGTEQLLTYLHRRVLQRLVYERMSEG